MPRWIGLVLMGGFASAGCNVFGADGESCTPLPPTQPSDLWSVPWVELDVPQGFCNVAAAYQYQIYTFGSSPILVDDYDGFTGEMTFPAGSRMTTLSGGGAEVYLGDTSGEVCGRHWNDCTTPGEPACQPLTIVNHDVFTATRNELPLYQDGAIGFASGAVWYFEPRYHSGTWRMDPATFEWEELSIPFPAGGNGTGGEFTGGNAITVGTDIWYLANLQLFKLDTVNRVWTSEGPTVHGASWDAPGVVHAGKLYAHNTGSNGIRDPGGFVFDPATKSTSAFDLGFVRQNMVGWERGNTLVYGGGNECDERNIGCWRQDFELVDPDTLAITPAAFHLPIGKAARAALDFDDRTIVIAQDSTAWLLLDSADQFVPLPRNPLLASCTPPVGPPGTLRQTTLTYGDDRAVVVGGEGADNYVTVYLR